MRAMWIGIGILALCVVAAGWTTWAQEKPAGNRSEVNPKFEQALLAAAKDYRQFERVDNQPKWAPMLCAPPRNLRSDAKFSQAGDAAAHGRKIYLLFAMDRISFLNLGQQKGAQTAVGQVVVKEAWTPEKVNANANSTAGSNPRADRVPGAMVPELPYTRDEHGELFRRQEMAALFVMLKLNSTTPETDAGWVYGTVTADGKTVTSAGRVASCMECHQQAPHDRLFGVAERTK